MRATSKRLCFIASMALSNNTLSGCFEPTLARGLTDFLLVHAAVMISSKPSTAVSEIRRDKRDIRPSTSLCGDSCPRLSAREARSFFSRPPLDFQQRRFRSRFQQRLRILLWITTTEHGVARHQNFPARPHDIAYGIKPHAAIYFDAEGQPALAANLA